MTTPSDKDRDEAPRIGSGYRDWEWAAHRLGEMMCADGPKGYYLFTPQQLVDWASSLPSRTVPETQPREGDDHPGPIAPLKGDTPMTDAAIERGECGPDFARQLEREVIAWQRQAKAMARAADNEKRRADAAPLSAIQPSGAWLPRSTNPDHDGLLWPITVRTDDGVLMMEFEYYHFDNGWATDEDIVAWWNQPVAPFSATQERSGG